ncbi:MAG: glycosyltransferase family 2 protein [Candidatus Omnitrophica bacterium]|nr:glycosyltransferase family 2 protein [Candidatus Omnitrophota bacterium]MDD5652839.1 glycosyltransferase family 2 protein [Candidatus Omnitrophota bacterium]
MKDNLIQDNNKVGSISVVIPAYNAQEFVAEAIRSALSQKLKPKEIIVVDDGSNDNTAEVVKSFSEVKYIYKTHSGVSSARNLGIENSGSEWIAFLDSDDIWKPGHLERLAQIINKYGLVWACSGMQLQGQGSENFIFSDKWKRLFLHGELFDNFFAAFACGAPFILSGMLIKKKALEEKGLFNVSFETNEDFDLFFKIASGYRRIGFAWPAAILRRKHKKSSSHGKAMNALVLLKENSGLIKENSYFLPTARFLAERAVAESLEKKDKKIIHVLLHDYKRLLGFWLPIAFLISVTPKSFSPFLYFIRTASLKVKRIWKSNRQI